MVMEAHFMNFGKTAVVAKNGKYGMINKQGQVILDFSYDSISLFNKKA